MTNVQRYSALLKKRESLDDKTKELEKLIFADEGSVNESVIQEWNKLELKRRELSVEVARQWQTLTKEERANESAKYKAGYGKKHG